VTKIGRGWISGLVGPVAAIVDYELDTNAFAGRIRVSAGMLSHASPPFILLDEQKRQWTILLTTAPEEAEAWVPILFAPM
jgi:hypothetical protein